MSDDTSKEVGFLCRDFELLIVFIHNGLKKLLIARGALVDRQCEGLVLRLLGHLGPSFLVPSVRYLYNKNELY